MAIASSFRDLNVYRQARETAQKIFELSRQFPAEERYSLTDQIRRSSRGVKAMIAEAWGRRRYKAVFVNKLGEATETQSWLDDARDSKYLSDDEFNEVDSNCIVICRMLSRMIDRAEDFCKHSPATDYRAISRVEEKESTSNESFQLEEFFV